MPPNPNKPPNRGPWSEEERRAIAIAEGRLRRVEAGCWPEAQRLSTTKWLALFFASRSDRRRR